MFKLYVFISSEIKIKIKNPYQNFNCIIILEKSEILVSSKIKNKILFYHRSPSKDLNKHK